MSSRRAVLDRKPAPESAWLGWGHQEWEYMTDGFWMASQALMERSERGGADLLVFPFMVCLRQYFELSIKGIIMVANQVIEKKQDPGKSHRLGDLWRSAQLALGGVSLKGLRLHSGAVSRLVKDFERFDRAGTAFRYPQEKRGRLKWLNIKTTFENAVGAKSDLEDVISQLGPWVMMCDGHNEPWLIAGEVLQGKRLERENRRVATGMRRMEGAK
jgi:hypothetical protein